MAQRRSYVFTLGPKIGIIYTLGALGFRPSCCLLLGFQVEAEPLKPPRTPHTEQSTQDLNETKLLVGVLVMGALYYFRSLLGPRIVGNSQIATESPALGVLPLCSNLPASHLGCGSKYPETHALRAIVPWTEISLRVQI